VKTVRKLSAALMIGAYLCVAFTAAFLLSRQGLGLAAGAGALAGVLALFIAGHALFTRGFDVAALKGELATLRDAHRLLADHLEETEGALEELATRLESEALTRTQTLTDEVKMLEDLVARMGEDLEQRLTATPAAAAGIDRASAALLDVVRTALAESRVDLYLQPVVSLPQRRVMFYESFTRLRDDTGRVIMPAEYLRVAEPEGLVSAIDNLLLFRCVQIVRRLAKTDRRVGIFCNISPASLADERFFPQFLEFLSQNKDLAGSLIFELGQSAFTARGAVESRNMAKLADLGFRFSLDKVTSLDLDFADLSRADVKFVKVGAEVLLAELLEVEGRLTVKARTDIAAADFASLTRRYGVELIAEKVEAERQVIDILELDVALGQGHLFGEPRPIRDDVLAETAPPAEFIQGPLRRRTAGRAA
jgi:cyclic-di-GMP phosphodiesterase TipF (flagellum assembly factor)